MTQAIAKQKSATKSGKTPKPSSASLPRATPARRNKPSTSKVVYRSGNEPLSQHDLNLLANLRQIPDSEINFSDAPATTARNFDNRSGILTYFKPYKHQITLRIDSDVLAWAKLAGAGYQSRINAALRKAMMEDLAPSSKIK